MDLSYKAGTEHTLRLSEPKAQAVTAHGCASTFSYKAAPNHTPVAQAVKAAELKGHSWPQATLRADPTPQGGAVSRCYANQGSTRGVATLPAYVSLPVVTLVSRATFPYQAIQDTPHAYHHWCIQPMSSTMMSSSSSIDTRRSANHVPAEKIRERVSLPSPVPLLRGLRRSRLRSTLRRGLLLRLCVRLGVLLLEVRKRIACLLRVQNPRATLRACRTRIRPAKVSAYDLARNAQRSSKILGPVRFRVRHINHLLSFTRLRTGYARYARIAMGISRGYATYHRDTLMRYAYAVRRYAAYVSPTYVRLCITYAYTYTHSTPPYRPPRLPARIPRGGRAERSGLAENFFAKSTNRVIYEY
jgi:hypothetical protein